MSDREVPASNTSYSGDVHTSIVAFVDAHNARDWDQMRALLVNDFVFVDRRPAGFGSDRGAEAYLRLLRVAIDLIPDRQITVVKAVDRGGNEGAAEGAFWELEEMEAEGTDENGGAVDWDFVAAWMIRGGLLAGLEVFPGGAVEEGRKRCREL
jgi:hypothetical protein